MQRFIFFIYFIVLLITVAACAERKSAQAAVDSRLVEGEVLYKANCKVCHAQAINGAPIPGNKKMWGARAQQGITTLVQHASEGYELMPAKGGNNALTDQQLELAITFMLSKIATDNE
ncbi:cytochrome c5 family protein [Oceanicoccus sp. KOV_DT_Chl]|uniref:c-type cytochrome n=1 Tax=Oceanicoccus sp. KOV_DT_Chl TaxID=1904639 RepID=UPI000C7CFD38|nr:c-type cytochrome [Oceanicoccus sp. KOV_DT_Chl]